MVVRSLFAAVCLIVALAVTLVGCAGTRSPQLTVLGVQQATRREVVFVQVTNPATRPMRLTKFAYTFASAGGTVSQGEVDLARDVPAGAAVVVEIPLDDVPRERLTLRGKLTAKLDQIVRSFTVSAQVQPR